MAYREDYGSLRPAKKLSNGQLRVDGFLTRTGVFVYRDAAGKERREYRPPEEVFHADSLESFAMVPVTDDHPPESVTASNARKYAVGSVGESIRRDGNHVAAALTVIDAETVAKMEAGKVQLSCGYTADVVDEPGVSPEGERYDAVQRCIRGNHVALVAVGRAGPSAAVRMDGAAMVLDSGTSAQGEMMNLEQALAALAAAQQELGAEKSRADSVTKSLADSEAKRIAAEATAASEKARADAAEKARADSAAGESERVRARVELESKASAILGDAFKADADDRDLMVAVVKRVDSFDVPADAPVEAVKLCFTNALTRADRAVAALSTARVVAANPDGRNDGVDPGEAARAQMIERNRTAWKGN